MDSYAALAEAVHLARIGDPATKPRALALARCANQGSSSWWAREGLTRHPHEDRFFVFGQIWRPEDPEHDLLTALKECPGRIVIRIDSAGGDSVYAAEVGEWLAGRKDDVIGIVTGSCYSAANLIFSGCQHRIARPEAKFMVHAVRRAACETAAGLVDCALELESSVQGFVKFMASRTRQSPEKVFAWLTGGEIYLTPDEAASEGLVDRVIPALVDEPRNILETLRDTVREDDEQLAVELAIALRFLRVKDPTALRSWLQPLLVEPPCSPDERESFAARSGVIL